MFEDDEESLFSSNVARPLADRLRPSSLDEIAGQDHLFGPDGPLRKMLESGHLSSFIFWGPPGCGKTTAARILARKSNLHFIALSAVFSGIQDLKKAFEEARRERMKGRGTLLFVDEIHRFNRAQQDGFLPYVENGTVILVGATTENPSFELNSALLSRCKVFVMKPLDHEALGKILARAEQETGRKLNLTEDARLTLMDMADGDGRYFINLLESLYDLNESSDPLDSKALEKIVQHRAPMYDKDREGHYNLISALHKSLRGSDPDAALYWAGRMMEGGEDPLYILRRLTRFAMEDVGMADPNALQFAISAWDAYERLGSPEGDLAIAQLVVYLGTAPKSNRTYTAWTKALKTARKFSSLNPPSHILNAPTKLMKEIGYGEGYEYDPDTEDGFSGQNYFPDGMPRQKIYTPAERGFEREIQKRLLYWERLRRRKNEDRQSS